MRVISQNGVVDAPYENFVFSITKNNSIVATRDSIERPSEIDSGVMAKYSTPEKAEKAMQLLHEAYSDMQIIFQNVEVSEIDADKFKNILDCSIIASIPNEQPKVEYINKAVFQFPKYNDL